MALRAVPDHPKFARLCNKLGIPKYAALGLLECIWHFTGRFAPTGNIGKYDDDEIEAWVGWSGERGMCVAALVECRWIDRDETHRLVVHDWHSHADDATRLAVKRAGLEFIVPTVSGQCRDSVAISATVSGLPEPEPVPEPEPDVARKFQKPTVLDIQEYASSRGWGVFLSEKESTKFYDYYQSKGWVVGKTKMRDWRASWRNWERGMSERGLKRATVAPAGLVDRG